MTDEMTQHSLSERLVRMEGKLDAYAAGQSATLAEHARRLDGHDKDIRELRESEAAPPVSVKSSSTAQWVGIGVSLLVALIGVLGFIVTLIRIIPDVP